MPCRRLGLSAAKLTLALALSACSATSPDAPSGSASYAATVERPPQFVLLSFDGSRNLAMWERTRAFAQAADAKLTYFVSGVYFLPGRYAPMYQAPTMRAGYSLIGFADDAEDIDARIDQVNIALSEGHAIGSHANGHFDGRGWTQAQWQREFDQFDSFVFGGYVDRMRNASRADPETARDLALLTQSFDKLELTRDQIVGFRAPFLGSGDGLFREMGRVGMKYDSSRTLSRTYWPSRTAFGFWDVPLAALRVPAGQHNGGYWVNSSDVGFYELQRRNFNAAATPTVGSARTNSRLAEEMRATYMAYFEENYYGNRAPIRIAHHFTQYWQERAIDEDGDGELDSAAPYLEALETFARTVCTMPEVRCVTFDELATWLDEHASEVSAYAAGTFPQLERNGGVRPRSLGSSESDATAPEWPEHGETIYGLDESHASHAH